MLRCYLMDPDTDVCQTEQPQISYSVDFTAEQSSAMGSPNLLGREGTRYSILVYFSLHASCAQVEHDVLASEGETANANSMMLLRQILDEGWVLNHALARTDAPLRC